ncbi:MAG: hypothetical protein QNL04_04810 [SAR324 cluster bacterium]|nr:hypothetical protein [SAR324 cluster bacterium]
MPIRLSRREFVTKATIGALSIPFLLEGLKSSLLAQTTAKPLIWLTGQSSSASSMHRFIVPELKQFLGSHFTNHIATSQIDEDANINGHILIVEGEFSAEPEHPHYQILKELSAKARAVILIGNEASYSSQHPEGYLNIEREFLYPGELPFIRIPGEPAQYTHLLTVLNHLILYGLPELDEFRRPAIFFDQALCDSCEFRKDLDLGHFSEIFGDQAGCLFKLGCKGQVTKNSCSRLKINGSSTWCVSVGHPCVGCSNPDYPEAQGLGLFGQVQGGAGQANSSLITGIQTLGIGAAALTTLGIITHAASVKQNSIPEILVSPEESQVDEEENKI